MTGKEQLVSKVGTEKAESWISIVNDMMNDKDLLIEVEAEIEEGIEI